MDWTNCVCDVITQFKAAYGEKTDQYSINAKDAKQSLESLRDKGSIYEESKDEYPAAR